LRIGLFQRTDIGRKVVQLRLAGRGIVALHGILDAEHVAFARVVLHVSVHLRAQHPGGRGQVARMALHHHLQRGGHGNLHQADRHKGADAAHDALPDRDWLGKKHADFSRDRTRESRTRVRHGGSVLWFAGSVI
jgi:hypothetical protein